MAKYLVTGVAGFIGSNIAQALLDRGEEVRGIDNFCHGRMENIASILNRIEFLEADIRDFEAVRAASKGVDYVLHRAALGSVPRSLANPLLSNDVNVS